MEGVSIHRVLSAEEGALEIQTDQQLPAEGRGCFKRDLRDFHGIIGMFSILSTVGKISSKGTV